MKLTIKHQESYSRGELLLRTFFGWLYILLPHYFVLVFVGIWSSILAFVTWWIILFTGRYPESMFEFQVKYQAWGIRVMARLNNLSDGYPAFGISASDEHTDFQVSYPEKLSRGLLLVKTFFGMIYVILPHIFVLLFRMIWNSILNFISWWAVLFTGKYPESFHQFSVGTIRWVTRINLYYGLWMTDVYPPFTGAELEDETETETKEIQES